MFLHTSAMIVPFYVSCSSTGNKIYMRFNVMNFSESKFVVRPNETTEEGAIGGEKDPSTSQEGGKQYLIMYVENESYILPIQYHCKVV